jgi:hypothetical protein
VAFTPFAFTDAQLVDIRRYCGYPAYGSGAVVNPLPQVMKYYLVLEYKLQNLDQAEGAVVTATYLANLNTLESAIPTASGNLDTATAGPWTHNPNELRDRERLFDSWRRRLCQFLGVPPGPEFGGCGGSIRMVV